MKLRYTSWTLLAVVGCWPLAALAQLQLLPDPQPKRVFAGDARRVTIVWHNAGDRTVDVEIHARIFQTSSATAVSLDEVPWKKLEVLPQQSVLESAQLDFPAVKAETKFLVQWLITDSGAGFQPAQPDSATANASTPSPTAGLTGRMPVPLLGTTEVWVYPTNLLAELKPLAADQALGVFDPQNQLKPLLKNLKLEFTDLENLDLENFSGRLAIIGPFESQAQMREGLAKQIQALAKKGAAIVWLQPPPEKRSKLQPSFYSVSMDTNAVVIVQPELIADLPGNPQSQLNLIYFCRLALHPQPPALPDLSVQP
jgi:hypothetical protein